ncbi:unnamed protein product, partial [Prorocentrum cordatum]
ALALLWHSAVPVHLPPAFCEVPSRCRRPARSPSWPASALRRRSCRSAGRSRPAPCGSGRPWRALRSRAPPRPRPSRRRGPRACSPDSASGTPPRRRGRAPGQPRPAPPSRSSRSRPRARRWPIRSSPSGGSQCTCSRCRRSSSSAPSATPELFPGTSVPRKSKRPPVETPEAARACHRRGRRPEEVRGSATPGEG